MSALRIAGAGALVTLLVACGGAAPARAPSAPAGEAFAPEPEPTSIAEAEARIARARAEISGGPGAASPSPPSPGPSQTLEPVTPTGGAAAAEAADDESRARDVGACATPCRALGSMRRAVDALCRLTGGEDPRCVEAQRTLGDGETRLAPCRC